MDSERNISCRYCGVQEVNPRCPLRGVREDACRMVTTMTWHEYRIWQAERRANRRSK